MRFICNSPCLSITISAAEYKTPVLLLLSVSFKSKFASRQVVCGRSGVPGHLTESEEPVSDKANLPSLSSVTFTSRCGFLGHFRAAAPKDHENS